MRNLVTLFCSLLLMTSVEAGQGTAPQGCVPPPPAVDWVCVNGGWFPPPSPPTPPPPPEPTLQVISVGEEVTGEFTPCCGLGTGVFEMLFELAAPFDGTLVVHLSSGAFLETRGHVLVAEVEVTA